MHYRFDWREMLFKKKRKATSRMCGQEGAVGVGD